MQSDPLNVWSGDGQSSRPAFQPQPKPKLNKTIIYSAVGAAAVVLLVAGVFGVKWFLYTIG